jgi:nucleoside-diphosphate-sugar epimerase
MCSGLPLAKSRRRLGGLRHAIVAVSNPRTATISGPDFIPITLQQDADIAVNDILGSDGKWRNLARRQLAELVPPANLWRWLDGRKLDAVVHLGAISSTTATDAAIQPIGQTPMLMITSLKPRTGPPAGPQAVLPSSRPRTPQAPR